MEVLTKEDLQAFRLAILSDIRELFVKMKTGPPREWLKNSDVKKLLKTSSNTVQRLRISGKLKSTKIGGVHYYRLEDIEKLFEPNEKISHAGKGIDPLL